MAGKLFLSSPGGGTPGGGNKQVQFNDSGVFGGAAQLFWDKATNRLGLGDSTPAQQLSLTKCMELLPTTASDIGVIYKNDDWFMHDFQHPVGGGAVPNGLNLFIGKGAGNFTTGSGATLATHGSYNIGVGYKALEDIANGQSNLAFGFYALKNTTSGDYNCAFGKNNLVGNVDGRANIAVGYKSLYYTVSGDYNVGIGNSAGQGVSGQSIHNNTLIGCKAGYLLGTGGNNNIFIGYQAGDNVTSGEKNVIIGYDLNALAAAGDYQLNIASLIFGDLGATKKVGINTSTMNETLNVGGAIRLGTSALTNAGTIRWNGTNFEGYSAAWLKLDHHIDDILTTQGDVLFRGAATSERLAPAASAGAFLVSLGAGANPIWYEPCTTIGDLMVHTVAGYVQRLAAGANTHVLTSNGAGALPSWQAASGGATKEFFTPCTTCGGTGASMSNIHTYAAAYLTLLDDFACINFRVPADFSSITSAAIMVIPKDATGTANWDIYSSYGQTGESCTTHTQGDLASTYNAVIDRVTEVSISGILTSLAANDMVGIKLMQRNNIHDVYVLGVRLKYS